MLDVKAVKERLKQLMKNEENVSCAREIEKAAVRVLGELDNFVHSRNDALYLACMDINKLKSFVEEVERIKIDHETKYYLALESALKDDTNE